MKSIPPSSNQSIDIGGRLGKYVILSELGRGGMAVVYKAHQTDLDRVVAIKVLFGLGLQQRVIDRFHVEARAVAKLNHANVIKIFEVGEINGVHYLAMEYIEGLDMLAYLHQKKPSFDEVVEVMQQVVEALEYCHKQGILHRDLKPTNILMRGNRPIIIDFGLAKALDPSLAVTLTLSGEVVGSPAYMSPEQARGDSVSPLSDICSLGIILYELISFKSPYLDPRSLHQTALNAIRAEPVPLRYLSPWLDPDFEAIVAKCMTKDLHDRYQSMSELLQDIFAYRHGLPVKAKPPGPFLIAWRFLKTSPILYVSAGILLLSVLVVFVTSSVREESKRAPWGLVLEESFNGPVALNFQSFDRGADGWKASQSWSVTRGRLEAFSTGQSFAVADQEFFGDLRIEFTVVGLNGSDNDFNFFLFGPNPDSAFRFSLGEWGSDRAKIEFGSFKRFPFNSSHVNLKGGDAYRVMLEKEGNDLRLYLNEKLVAHQYHTLPVQVRSSQKFGFYTWNSSLAIDDLKIYKKAVALSPGPTVVADAYLEEGFISNSIHAYRHVIETYPNSEIAYEAHLKLAKGFMVQKNYTDAIHHLTVAASNSKDNKVVPEALFRMAQCYFNQDKAKEGYEKLKLIPMTYPQSEYNMVLVGMRMEAVYQCLNSGADPSLCAGQLSEEFRFLIQKEDRLRHLFGRHYADLVGIFRRQGVLGPVQNSLQMLEYFQENREVRQALQLQQALHFVAVKNFPRAKSILSELRVRDRVDRDVLGQVSLLEGQMAFLEGQNSLAAELFDNTYRHYGSVQGLPFRCILNSLLINRLTNVSVKVLEARLYSHDAASRRERLQLAYLADKIPEDYFRRGVHAGGRDEMLEDILVDFLKIEKVSGLPKALEYLSRRREALPPQTFERAYLDYIIEKNSSDKRI